MSKHKYSTIALIFIFSILLIAGATAILTSEDIDDICDDENSFLYRFNDTYGWGCGIIDGNEFNVTINSTNITYIELEPQGNNGSIQFNDEGRMNGTTGMTWDKTNSRLGIGENTPEHELEIKAQNARILLESTLNSGYHNSILETRASTNTRASGLLVTNTASNAKWFFGVPYNAYGMFFGYSGSASENDVYQSGAAKMFIKSTGEIGMGTIVPQNTLDVEGAVAIGASYSGTSTAPTNGLIVEGNSGFGTNNPSKLVDISTGLPSGVLIGADVNAYTRSVNTRKLSSIGSPDYTNTKTIEYFTMDSKTAGRNAMYFGGRESGSNYGATELNFMTTANTATTGGTVKMHIDNSGNVGINTTTPSELLDIHGNTNIFGQTTQQYGVDFATIQPGGTVALSLIAEAGNVDAGIHYYYVTYYTADGETKRNSGTVGSITTNATHGKVNITLPISTDERVIGRKIYRSPAGFSSSSAQYMTTIANNIDTYYTDNIADSGLSGTSDIYYKKDTTNKLITIDGTNVLSADENQVSLGPSAGASITTGGRNTLIGNQAGALITTGTANNVIGYQALLKTSTGYNNEVMGYGALQQSTTGHDNIAIGRTALLFTQTGSYNTAVGSFAGFGNSVTSVHGNTMVGYLAGYDITSNYNTMIGYKAGYSQLGQKNIMIGHDMQGSAGDSYKLEIGVDNIPLISGDMSTSTIALEGDVGIGTTNPDTRAHITGNSSALGDVILRIEDEYTGNGATSMEIKSNGGASKFRFTQKDGYYWDWVIGTAGEMRYDSSDGASKIYFQRTIPQYLMYGDSDGLAIGGTNPTEMLDVRGNTLIQNNLTIGEELTVASYERHLQIPVISVGSPADLPTPVDVGTAGGYQFASSGSREELHLQFEVPADWDGISNITVEIDWLPDSGAMTNPDAVMWNYEYRSVAEGESLLTGTSVSKNTTYSTTTAQYLTVHSPGVIDYQDANQPVSHYDHIYMVVGRDTTVANDFTGTVVATSFEILYNSNSLPRI